MDYIIDIETDGIDATMIHCMSVAQGNNWLATFVTYNDMKNFFSKVTKDDRIIGHNFIRYDAPVLERILGIKIEAQIIDTLALSWYLNPERRYGHGLAKWGETLGIAKPEVDDWEGAGIDTYINRCEQDVMINNKLWEKFSDYLNMLYSGKPDKLLRYLSHKLNCAKLQEASRWKLDVVKAKELLADLESSYDKSRQDLEKVMPKVAKYVERNRPVNMYKKDGTLSIAGTRWFNICQSRGYDYETHQDPIKIVSKLVDPNPTSLGQVKDWLFTLKWKPATFDIKKGGRAVPQIKTKEGNLCPSVEKLIADNKEVSHLATMTVVKSRIHTVAGLLANCSDDGYVKAEIQGLTNTLRFRHAVCVNIPSERKPYGKEVRELLTAPEGSVLCGSDMSSLEDRTKQHYMWNYDQQYVKDMQVEGFDPHLDLALTAGAVTQEQVDAYKDGTDKSISDVRHTYKGGNYACTYGAGIKTLARQLGIPEGEASKIHRAYWKRNWAVKSIANDCRTKTVGEYTWLLNPVSGLYYWLKADKDKFSTLNQGTGTYCFDMWLGFLIKDRPQLTGQFHDEVILQVSSDEKDTIHKLLKGGIHKVNKILKLNRDLDCDIQFGENYSQIH